MICTQYSQFLFLVFLLHCIKVITFLDSIVLTFYYAQLSSNTVVAASAKVASTHAISSQTSAASNKAVYDAALAEYAKAMCAAAAQEDYYKSTTCDCKAEESKICTYMHFFYHFTSSAFSFPLTF